MTTPSDVVERRAFADLVLLSEIEHPHDDTVCRVQGHCPLREALRASTERITAELAPAHPEDTSDAPTDADEGRATRPGLLTEPRAAGGGAS